VSARYVVLPKADRDLDDASDYFVNESGGLEVGLSFLAAAQETFDLLASQPAMGWQCRLKNPALDSVRVFRVTGFEDFLSSTDSHPSALRLCAFFTALRTWTRSLRKKEPGISYSQYVCVDKPANPCS
jgi:ParE toxin of type II toxin-antitoxin system, parDE